MPFLFLLALRLLNALTIRTFFQPDEYFQSLEPAYNLVFGTGYLTWEWHHQLRSILHPLIFASIYRLIALLPLSSRATSDLLIVAPKILQAVFAALGDWGTIRFAERVAGKESAQWAKWITAGSAWLWFCSTRTFSNSLETSLTAMGLGCWPWERKGREGLRWALLCAAVGCVLRPTNVMIWVCLAGFKMWASDWKMRRLLVVEATWIGSTVVAVNALLDRAYYGVWTFPPLKFLTFNLVQSLSVFYGRNDWHYYLSQGLPLLLTGFLPLALYALYTSTSSAPTSPPFQLSTTVSAVITIYSCIAHKEVRFLSPLLPILHVLSAHAFTKLQWSPAKKQKALYAMLAINLPVAGYTALVHQRGVIDVMAYLRDTEALWQHTAFLMPCHSTPWVASMGLINDKTMWALTCEPPIGLEGDEKEAYVDQADVFYAEPRAYWDGLVAGWEREEEGGGMMDRIVVFEALENTMYEDEKTFGDVWRDLGFTRCWSGFNSHVHDDSRRRGDVVVYCKAGTEGWD